MFFEVQVKLIKMNDKGVDKPVTEKIIVKDVNLFSEAEFAAMQEYNGEADVVAMKISKIKEFVNSRSNDEEDIYFVTIEDLFVDGDTGEVKSMLYPVALFAETIDSAKDIANEYIKQGLSDMTLVAIKKTKFIDLI
jgi:phosphopantetheine adenylyltransferase